MRALMQLGGMSVVLCFLTIAFTHAFWAMARENLQIWDLFSVLKLLFTGEVDEGIDPLSSVLPDDQKIFLCILANGAIIVFLVCFVNLFIAVLSDNYQAEQERLVFTLFRERAHVCCNLFLAPSLGKHWAKSAVERLEDQPEFYVNRVFVGTCLAGASVWVALTMVLLYQEVVNFVAVAVAASGILVLQGFIRGWLTCDFSDACHLWICHDKCFDETRLLLTEDTDIEVQGRIARLRGYIHEQVRMLGLSLKRHKDVLIKRHKDTEKRLVSVFTQLTHLSCALGFETVASLSGPEGNAARRVSAGDVDVDRLGSEAAQRQGGATPMQLNSVTSGAIYKRRSGKLDAPLDLRGHTKLRESSHAKLNSPGRVTDGTQVAMAEDEIVEHKGTVQTAAEMMSTMVPGSEHVWAEALSRNSSWPTLSEAGELRQPSKGSMREALIRGCTWPGVREAEVGRRRCFDGVREAAEKQRADQALAIPPTEAVMEDEAESASAEEDSARGLREEIQGLREDLQQRDEVTRSLRQDVEALREELRRQRAQGAELGQGLATVQALREELRLQREQGETLQHSAAEVAALREDIRVLCSDVQQQRADGQTLQSLVEQVLQKFDGAVAAAATGQEILKLLPAHLHRSKHKPREPAPSEPAPTDLE